LKLDLKDLPFDINDAFITTLPLPSYLISFNIVLQDNKLYNIPILKYILPRYL